MANYEFISKVNKEMNDDVRPHHFVSLSDVYAALGLSDWPMWAKDKFNNAGWYIEENGKPVFGSYGNYLVSDQFKAGIMYQSNNYISQMKELSEQWAV